MSDVIVTSIKNLQNGVRYGDEDKSFIIDEPESLGGDSAGPDPYTLLLAALGGCISMTVTMYARRKQWPLERVTVRLRQRRIHATDCVECETRDDSFIHRIEYGVEFEGELTAEQLARLNEIALKCPVRKTLSSEIVFGEIKD